MQAFGRSRRELRDEVFLWRRQRCGVGCCGPNLFKWAKMGILSGPI